MSFPCEFHHSSKSNRGIRRGSGTKKVSFWINSCWQYLRVEKGDKPAQSFLHHKTPHNVRAKNSSKTNSRVNNNNLYILKLNQQQTLKMQSGGEREKGEVGPIITEKMETSGPSSWTEELFHGGVSPDHPNCLLLRFLIPSRKVALIMSDSLKSSIKNYMALFMKEICN